MVMFDLLSKINEAFDQNQSIVLSWPSVEVHSMLAESSVTSMRKQMKAIAKMSRAANCQPLKWNQKDAHFSNVKTGLMVEQFINALLLSTGATK